MKTCTKCNIEKPLSEFSKDVSKLCGLQSNCKTCRKFVRDSKIKEYNYPYTKKYMKNYYETHKEELLSKQKSYKEQNKETIKHYQKEYRVLRRSTDITFRLSEMIRGNVRRIFKHIGTKKEDKSYSIVNYTPIELKIHLESLFKDGMTWENYGYVWEIDHTIPIYWYIKNQENFIDKNHLCREANALSNLTPMFFDDNRRKSAKY